MWTRSELKDNAKTTFKNNYWLCVLISFILIICEGSSGGGIKYTKSSPELDQAIAQASNDPEFVAFIMGIIGVIVVIGIAALVLKLLVFNVLIVGGRRFYTENQIKKASIDSIGFAFKKGRYLNTLITMFLKDLFIFLWSLLLIIPGIIKSYSYFMVEYIMSENPNISRKRAFEISKQTMNGQKWNTFVLDLSFIGWVILSLFTCGILAVFYVNPYIHSTKAQLYLTLRNIALDNGIATSEELCGINY